MEGGIKFRVDLEVFPYDDVAEKETVVLKDPLSGKYYYLSTYEYRLLSKLDGTLTMEEAVDRLLASGHYYSTETAGAIVSKAAQLGLVLGTKFGTAQYQTYIKQQAEKAKKERRFSSVYFLFIPLINPDRFLDRTMWLAKLVGNRYTAALTALALPGAIYLLLTETQRIQGEFLFFFSWENLLYLWITLAFTKLIHEFAHAYAAKSFGLHIPQMGVAFLIFFPCLFCNTTDAWQLADRRQRMVISAAGILVEGALAILATYVWYFSRPGVINSLAFYLMAISFISTVIFNGNPLMRFDGYFILMDWLRLPNLATRAFAYVKYLFMNRLLGISLVPNPATTGRESRIFLIYGVSAAVYRVFLYTGIVLGVYYRFDKLLGITLALLAFFLFIVRPILKGVRTIYTNRQQVHVSLSGIAAVLAVSAAIIGVLFVPISSKSIFPCYLSSAKVQKLTVPLHTSVREVFVREGTSVSAGDLLFTLETAELRMMLAKKNAQREILRTEKKFLLLDNKHREQAASKEIEIRQLDNEIDRIKKDLAKAEGGIVAPFDGVVASLDYKMQQGFQPGEGTVVGELASPQEVLVYALISEKDSERVSKGQQGKIWFHAGVDRVFEGTIDDIRPYSEQDLKDSPFSSRFGGELATESRGEGERDVPLEAQYQCSLSFEGGQHMLPLGVTGRFAVQFPSRTLWARIMDKISLQVNKESLF